MSLMASRWRLAAFGAALACFAPMTISGFALTPPAPAAPGAGRDTVRLFQRELQDCSVKLKWHGERLTDDTVYAATLTGLSWQPAWGKEHLFSLAWGDIRKVDPLRRRSAAQTETLIAAIRQRAAAGDYAAAAQQATENFATGEIGCQPALKAAVGASLLALNRPEQAFDVFAAPFDPAKVGDVTGANRMFRQGAFEAASRLAQKSGDTGDAYRRDAIAFALSLLLEPDSENAAPDNAALTYLQQHGVDVDRVLLGILESPEKLRALPAYWYAASDLLALRATPRLLPFLMHLAQSDDVYLRGRAVVGLGILAYQSRPNDAPGWQRRLIAAPLQEYGLSVGERKLIEREAKEAAGSDKYRLRQAAAIALALMGDDANLPLLQKLAKDRAYLLAPEERGRGKNAPRRIQFPVRMAAAAGLARYGVTLPDEGGTLAGKDLERARRGGQDMTSDRRNLRKETYSLIAVSPLDSAFLFSTQ